MNNQVDSSEEKPTECINDLESNLNDKEQEDQQNGQDDSKQEDKSPSLEHTGTRKLNSFLPKLKHNRLEPINFKINFPSLDHIKDKIPKTSPFRRKSRINVNESENQNFDNESLEGNKRIIEVVTNQDIPKSRNSLKNGKVVFVAPQQPGEPFIPIQAYHESNENQNDNQNLLSRNQLNFEIIWRNLTFYPSNAKFKSDKKQSKTSSKCSPRPILNNISGMFRSGQMTGIMGPSGAGKTVLLNCIAGFLQINSKKQNSGDILVNGVNMIRIGFVEQFDRLYSCLTVLETLLFTSKIRNAARFYLNHEKIVRNVMDRLDIADIANNRVSKCSSGQRKRISIAIELVFNSDILMLDEPTTGVDSVSGFQIMSIMKSLTKRRKAIAILATIHQPSARIFSLFDNLIILSKEGTIIFQGHPNDLPQTLQLVGLSCPMYTSISDFILEVASGDFGRQCLHLLTHYNNDFNRNRFTEDFNEVEMHSLREAVKYAHISDQRSVLFCTWLVLCRGFICDLRNPFNTKIRIVSMIAISLIFGLVFTDSVGQISTCPTKYSLWNLKMENFITKIEQQNLRSRENCSVLFILTLVSLFNSMLNLSITIPEEIYVFRREYNNYSYTIFSFFMAKILSQLPFTMTTTAAFTWAIHHLTGQFFDDWNRIFLMILPCCLITLIGEFIGIMIGVLFYESQIQAIYAITFMLVPMMLCSGFFKLVKNMNSFMAILSYISFLRPALNSLLVVIYGIGRCYYQSEIERKQVDQLNITGEYHRPQWIENIVSLIDLQTNLINENLTFSEMYNETMESEEKLARYMHISLENGSNKKAAILQYLDLSSNIDFYWEQIMELIYYNIFFAVLLYIIMFIRLKRQKN